MSDSEWYSDDSNPEITFRGRRNIKHVKTFGQLSSLTKAAYVNEQARRIRIANHQNELFKFYPNGLVDACMILDFDDKTKKPNVVVDPILVSLLKEHQKEGVRFMWNSCFETVPRVQETVGGGCIIAHCMGLGKTMQVVTLTYTLLTNSLLAIKKVLILCPKNTLLNWVCEFDKWIKSPLKPLKVYNLGRSDESRFDDLRMWQKTGGVCVTTYTMFRLMAESKNHSVYEALVNPGADVVVCDEGHVLKNCATKLAKVIADIRTARRIVLTGTPLQNNLIEYFCMVAFVRPHLLGTKAEFSNMFINPIQNGQYENSLPGDVELMKARAHVLHHHLSHCIQRYDLTTLAAFLPPKLEFVVCVRLTQKQVHLYSNYLGQVGLETSTLNKLVKGLFSDYQLLQRVWTHPFSLRLYDLRLVNASKNSRDDEDDEEYVERPQRYKPGWWRDFVNDVELEDVGASAKLTILFEIIQQCVQKNDKLLIFSGSLFTLDTIQHFLNKTWPDGSPGWELGSDYFMLTGATPGPERDDMCRRFNDPDNGTIKAFLISTRAGGLGITLNAANRAVIFDASWNPSHDVQSMFRIYRLGQAKPCYIYRLIALGTMEEKIYERQVTKQSTSRRVVDEKQIARHYSHAELKELYSLEPDKCYNSPDITFKDDLLKAVVNNYSDIIGGYHEHDSLLEHMMDEELLDIQKKGAWSAFSDGDAIGEDQSVAKFLTADKFQLCNFKIVLRRKFPRLHEANLIALVNRLMPRINQMLNKQTFPDDMLQEHLKVRSQEELQKVADTLTNKQNNGGNRKRDGRVLPVPIRSWGSHGGKEYGEPDVDSD